MMDLVFALAPGGARRVAFGLDAAAPSVMDRASAAVASGYEIAAVQAGIAAGGLKTLTAAAAASVLGPEVVVEIESLKARSVTYLESTRSPTDVELTQAKRTIGMYDQILANTALLERFRKSGVPLSNKSNQALESGKQYLITFAQPVDLAKRMLGGPRLGDDESFGFLPVIAAALGLSVGELIAITAVAAVLFVALSLSAAVIVLAVCYAVSASRYAEAIEATEETRQQMVKCAQDPNSPPEIRTACGEALKESERNPVQPPPDPLAGLTNLLWVGGAILGLGVLAYVASPFLSELGKTGASELGALRQGRERSRLARIEHGHDQDTWFDADGHPMLLEGGS